MTANGIEFLPFALPDIGEEEIAAVVEVLRSGWLTTGPRTRQFENAFIEFMGGGVDAISVNSATAGLHIALEALGIGPDDEVITTTYTFTATAEVVRYLGAHPVLVDIDPETLNLDVGQVEARISPRTKAIVPVHFAGLACSMDELLSLARRHGVAVIEDAAHALPATYKGRLIGTLKSDAVVFSFYATKPVTTGEGGMVVTKRRDIADRCRIMRLHGISRDSFERYTSTSPAWYYEVVAPGFKYNLTDIASAIGIEQLRKALTMQQRRETMARRYHEALVDLPLRLPPIAAAGDLHAWHLYVLRLLPDAPCSRDEFIAALFARGIGCSVHFIPLHLQPVWRNMYKLTPTQFPHAQSAFEAAVSLPLYTRMSDSDQQRVIDAVREVFVEATRE